MKNDVSDYFRLLTDNLVTDFSQASVLGKGTPQEISDRRENAFQDFIHKLFPLQYVATKGQIIDSYGSKSHSIDCILLNQTHPSFSTDSSKYPFILVEGVNVAFEIKSSINKHEVFMGLKQLTSVKKCIKNNGKTIDYEKYIKQDSSRCMTFLYIHDTNTSKKDILKLYQLVKEYYITNPTELVNQVDYIIVVGLGILVNCKDPRRSPLLNPKTGYKSCGVTFIYSKESTMLYMIHILMTYTHNNFFYKDSEGHYLRHYILDSNAEIINLLQRTLNPNIYLEVDSDFRRGSNIMRTDTGFYNLEI